jgi:hypothetical protein
MRFLLPVLLLLLASCGGSGEEGQGNGAADLPEPSGPPVAQQVDTAPTASPPPGAPAWESAASLEGTAIRLTQVDGKLLLSVACLRGPVRLVATAPGFSPIGSEDRFSLGLGDEPVTLVADPTPQAQSGVTAEGAVPDRFEELLEEAKQVSALYGTQRIGPVPAPSEALKKALAKSCTPK